MNDPCAYNITVRRGVFDGEQLFEARVRELPDVAEYADTYQQAYDLAIDSVETTAAALLEVGRGMPAPLVPADDYSGRVTLRVPRSLHRSLCEVAADEGVSLNQHIVNVLGFSCGYATAMRERAPAKGTWTSTTAYVRPAKSVGSMGQTMRLAFSRDLNKVA